MKREVLSRGAVMVDARAAVARLRGHQLVEPAIYAAEMLRAAVAGGATRVTLRNDADDFELSFDGDPVDAAELARLLDHLLSDVDARLRLLAVALNTALGLGPRYVDLYTSRHPEARDDRVARVRWTASRDAATLDHAALSLVPRPASMPTPGMHVHVREAFGMPVVREWLVREPAETRVLRERLALPRVPLLCNDVALAPRWEAALATVPLVLSGDLRGELALVPVDAATQDVLVLAERGVTLETLPLHAPGRRRPLRMVVDGDAMPTNASRSKVTMSKGLWSALRRAWRDACPRLVDAAVAALPDEARVAEALAALVLAEAGAAWADPRPAVEDSDTHLGPLTQEAWTRLLAAKFVPRVTGAPVSPRELTVWPRREVWNRSAPPPTELAPWFDHALMLPHADSALTALVTALPTESADAALARAREARARQSRFLALPEGDVDIADDDAALRARFEVDGARGVVVVTTRGLQGAGELRMIPWVMRRPLGAEVVARSAVGALAAVEARGLHARADFEGAAHDEAWELAAKAARRCLVDALTALALWWRGALAEDDPRGDWISPTLDRADGTLRGDALGARIARACWAERLALDGPSALASPAVPAALRDAPAWATTDPRRFVSTAALQALVAAPPRVLLTAHDASGRTHPAGRPVLVLDGSERATLSTLLGAAITWVDYTPWLAGGGARDLRASVEENPALRGLPWAAASRGTARMVVAPAPSGSGRMTLLHLGRVVEVRTRGDALGAALVFIEDDALLPASTGNAALGPLGADASTLAAQAELTLVDALRSGEVRAESEEGRRATTRFLLSALRVLSGDATRAATCAAIEAMPLVPVYGEGDRLTRVSLDALEARHARSGALPWLKDVPTDVDGAGFEPLILGTRELVEALTSYLGASLRDVSSELGARRDARTRRLALEAHRRKPKVASDGAWAGAAEPVVTATLDGVGAVALVAAPSPEEAVAQCLFEDAVAIERAAVRLVYPVRARLSFLQTSAFRSTLDGLSAEGERVLETLVELGAQALIRALATTTAPGDAARGFVTAWANLRGRRRMHDDPTLREALLRARLWRTPEGTPVALAAYQGAADAIPCVLGAVEAWLPPAQGEDADPLYLCVDNDAQLRAVASITGGTARDVTQTFHATQRARALRHRDAAAVRLPGSPEIPALSARIEATAPALGVGEARVLDGAPAIEVTLWCAGRRLTVITLRAAFHMEVALESPAVDPTRVAETFHGIDPLPKLLRVAHTMAARVSTTRERARPWVRRFVRWWLLHDDDAPRDLALFEDTAGDPMSLDDLSAQHARHGDVAFVTAAPDEPVTPREPHRRVVVLSADERASLDRRHRMRDYATTLREDLLVARWSRGAPRERVTLTASLPRGAARMAWRDAGVEGELALLPPGTTQNRCEVTWHVRHRALGTTELDAVWPGVVAVNVDALTPDLSRGAPVEDDAWRAACEAVREAMQRALEQHLAAPDDALAWVRAHDAQSITTTRARVRVAGAWWLTDDIARGRVDRDGPDGRVQLAVEVPVQGKVWVRASAADTRAARDEIVARGAAHAWRRLLEVLVARARSEPASLERDDVVCHLAHAALSGALDTAGLRNWARRATLPGCRVTYARLGEPARKPLALLPPDAARDRDDAVPDVDAPWVTLLRTRGVAMAPAPQRAAVAVETRTSVPAPATTTTSAPRAAWPADAVRELLLRAGVPAEGLRSAAVADDAVGAGEAAVRYDPRAASITVMRAHPAVLALRGRPVASAVRVLALAAMGAVARGGEHPPSRQLAWIDALLRAIRSDEGAG